MDSFELNKIMGAILGTCMFVLGLQIFSGALFTPPKPAVPGYDLPAPEADAGKAEAAKPAEPLPVLLAKADPAKGQASAKKCMACHDFTKGGPNKIGPNLYGVVGRARASHEGFNYSSALKAKGGNWDYAAIDEFIANPKKDIPGTIMAFAGDPNAEDRANLLAYLKTLADSPVPFPAP